MGGGGRGEERGGEGRGKRRGEEGGRIGKGRKEREGGEERKGRGGGEREGGTGGVSMMSRVENQNLSHIKFWPIWRDCTIVYKYYLSIPHMSLYSAPPSCPLH